MPRVKVDYIVSFSSEDSENEAKNLLAHDVSKKKWLCKEGEPSCSVVLQLAKAVQISTVHIGACHAALVEVLVGRSEKPNDQFEVLVPSSVFLSPLDSRRGSGVERVRSFTGDQLGPGKAGRWDRVRAVCSQPYNKHCKYGLSFIHIFEPEDKLDMDPKPESTSVAAAVPGRMLALDNFSSDEDDFRPGEMFAKHRTSEQGTSGDTGAQIRQATSQALKNISDSSTKLVKTPIIKANTNRPNQSNDFNTNRQRDSLMYTDDDELPHTRIDKVVQRHKDDKEQERKKEQKPEKKETSRRDKLDNSSRTFKEFIDDKDKRKDTNDSRKDINDSRKDKDTPRRKVDDNQHNSRDDDRPGGSKDREIGRNRNDGQDRENRKRDEDRSKDRDNRKRPHPDAKEKDKELRPGPVSATPHTLLSGTVFALSGYENPRRARLRDAAVAMGARFERDWSPACTHLICAFSNTPKLKTVRASRNDCIAVLGEWIEQCCEKRRLLPWQWFATEPKKRVAPPENYDDDDDKTASEYDTDDEIEKVLQKQKKQRTDKSPPNNRDRSPRPQSSKDRSPKPHTSREKSPKAHTSREKSPKAHTSRDKSPKAHTSREKSPKAHTSRDKSPKAHSNRQKSPKPHTSREKSPKPHTSREKSPKPHTSREKSPKPHTSREKSPKAHTNRQKSPSSKKDSLDFSNTSTDSDIAFVRDERIQANITIDSDDETDEEKPCVKEKFDKKSLLPDFFEGYTFVIDDGVKEAGFDMELLNRYIKAYGGVVMDPSLLDSDSQVNFFLSTETSQQDGGKRIRPDWIWRCHEDKRMCEVAEYTL